MAHKKCLKNIFWAEFFVISNANKVRTFETINMDTTHADIFHQNTVVNSPYFDGPIHGRRNKLVWFMRMDTKGRDDP